MLICKPITGHGIWGPIEWFGYSECSSGAEINSTKESNCYPIGKRKNRSLEENSGAFKRLKDKRASYIHGGEIKFKKFKAQHLKKLGMGKDKFGIREVSKYQMKQGFLKYFKDFVFLPETVTK